MKLPQINLTSGGRCQGKSELNRQIIRSLVDEQEAEKCINDFAVHRKYCFRITKDGIKRIDPMELNLTNGGEWFSFDDLKHLNDVEIKQSDKK